MEWGSGKGSPWQGVWERDPAGEGGPSQGCLAEGMQKHKIHKSNIFKVNKHCAEIQKISKQGWKNQKFKKKVESEENEENLFFTNANFCFQTPSNPAKNVFL